MLSSEPKVRTPLTLPKELKAILEDIAKQEARSLNSLMVKALADYAKAYFEK